MNEVASVTASMHEERQLNLIRFLFIAYRGKKNMEVVGQQIHMRSQNNTFKFFQTGMGITMILLQHHRETTIGNTQ